MGEKAKKSKSEKPQYVAVPTGMSLAEYYAYRQRRAAQEAEAMRVAQMRASGAYAPQGPGQQPLYSSFPQYPTAPRPQEFQTSTQERKPRSPERRRRVGAKAVLAVAGVVAAAGAVAYGANLGNVQEVFSSASSGDSKASGMEIAPLETYGEKSLAPNQCKQPEAVLMVATVSGSLPLIPLVATTENATPTMAAPYLTEENKGSLSKKEQEKFESFITESGYPEATLHQIPLALTICEMPGANAVTEQDGSLTINRSALEVSFEDPSGLFGSQINAVLQVEGAHDVELDPSKGEFMSIPNPANNMFLSTNDDEVYNASVSELMTGMQDPVQLQILLSLMEADSIGQVDNVVDGHENIDYPDNAETLQEAIDRALIMRLVGDAKVSPAFAGNYNVQVDVPKDAATKEPITTLPLKGMTTGKFRITDVDIEFGSLTPPTQAGVEASK